VPRGRTCSCRHGALVLRSNPVKTQKQTYVEEEETINERADDFEQETAVAETGRIAIKDRFDAQGLTRSLEWTVHLETVCRRWASGRVYDGLLLRQLEKSCGQKMPGDFRFEYDVLRQ